jgi:serine/threonine protein kinase
LGKKDLDNRVDVWAAGVILYYMCEQFYPFDDDNVGTIVAMIIAEDRPCYPPESATESIKKLLMMCLEKDPKKRPYIENIILLPEI